MRLGEDFFVRDTVTVARELLGKRMVCGDRQVVITETEAYVGEGDPACHAARGRTPRTEVMFGKPGVLYVYFIYGMYFCMNVVTEQEGFPAAVLIRGVVDLDRPEEKLDGPGKLCRSLGITKDIYNGLDSTVSPALYFEDMSLVVPYEATPRIGIKQGTERLWRFVGDVDLTSF